MSGIVNLDEVVESWAWDMFYTTASDKQKKIPKDALALKINWKKVNFVHEGPDYEDNKKSSKPQNQVLFKSNFTNETEQEQDYSFRTERVTRSTCEVFYEKGYSMGYEMSITLKTPCEVFEANSGFHREINVNKCEGEIVEEEMTWGVDNQIRVPAKHKCVAELVISEEQFSSNFTIITTFEGQVHVVFTNMSDNNSFVKAVDGEIGQIFKDKGKKYRCFTVDGGKVSVETKGTTKFRYGIEQHVRVHQEPLDY
ncbi:uncharacterized protein LOC141914747 [Tubulanus polymorphus]|uniref:uncharacterized protein LOC141914747 n=1 Tax=Tubulanus polymorphus TaxID=672921 RepID=UPI003DA2849D